MGIRKKKHFKNVPFSILLNYTFLFLVYCVDSSYFVRWGAGIGECKYRNSGIYKSGNNFFQIENKRFSLVVLSTLWQRLTNIYSKILKHLFSFFALFMELYMGGDWLWRSDLYVSSWKVNKGQLWLIFLLILRFCVKDTWSNSSIKTLEIVNLEGWSTKFKNYIFTSYNIGLNSHNKIWDLERI